MADPVPSRTSGKWLWPVIIALLAIILLVWLFSPSGDREGEVEDPITTPELSEEPAPGPEELDLEAEGAAAEDAVTTTEPAPAPAGQ